MDWLRSFFEGELSEKVMVTAENVKIKSEPFCNLHVQTRPPSCKIIDSEKDRIQGDISYENSNHYG